MAEILLSDSKLRFSATVSDAIDFLDEEELQEVQDQLARDRGDDAL